MQLWTKMAATPEEACSTGAVAVSVKVWTKSCIFLQVLTEIAGETLDQMAAAPKNKAAPARAAAVAQEQEEADAEASDLQARLDAIRS